MTDLGTPSPAAPAPPPSPPAFRFLRSRSDRRLGGVAGGLAVAAGLDPALVRVAVVLAAFTGWGLLAYLVAWIVLPVEDPAAGRVLVPAPERTARFTRIGVAVAGGLGALRVVGGLFGLTVGSLGLLTGHGFGWGVHDRDFELGPAGLLGLVLLVWGAVVLLRRREQAAAGPVPPPPPPGLPASGPPPPQPTSLPAAPAAGPAGPVAGGGWHDIALLLLRVGGWLLVLWFLGGLALVGALWATGALHLRWPLLLALTAAGALAILVRTLLRSRRLGVLVAAAAALAVPPLLGATLGHWDGRAGYRSVAPTSPAEVERAYRHAVGQLDLDFSGLSVPAGTTTRVAVDMGAGEVRVTVPWDATVRASGRVGLGGIDLFGREQGGFGARDRASRAGVPGAGTLELSAHARAGRITVERAPAPPGAGQTLACTIPEGGGISECRPAGSEPPGAPPAPGRAYLCKPRLEGEAFACRPV